MRWSTRRGDEERSGVCHLYSERRALVQHGGEAETETLTFVYENVPQQQLEQRSNRHFGTCGLDIGSLRPTTISGVYFTGRYTKGT